jgi:mannonate dehydratase
MTATISRRGVMQVTGAAAFLPSASWAVSGRQWPIVEGPDTPVLCMISGDGGGPMQLTQPGQEGTRGGANQDVSWKRIQQLGIKTIIGGNLGSFPWEEANVRAAIQRAKDAGMTLYNTLISVPNNVVFNRPGRDNDIQNFIKSLHVAGKAGLPVVEYNLYLHRAMEGYFEETGRAGSGHTGFDYSKMKDLPALEPKQSLEESWKNIAYFLKAVIPEAEKAGIRMALHPNDPPAPLSRGYQQPMGTLAGWKRLISIVDSPANGITFDSGVTREMGEDPVEVCHYFASRKRINHVHFRNVILMKPYERYKEVFLDEGQVDMFGVMKELVRAKYKGTIYPEHPRGLDYDRERPGFRPQYGGGGGYAAYAFNVAYARAMLQAALASV